MTALWKNKYWLGLVIAAMLLLIPCASAYAAESDAGEEASPKVSVTLDKKTRDAVITTVGDRYGVSKQETTIVGLDGQQVTIYDLMVPCDVQVTYHAEKGVRKADRIKIIRISSSAKKAFSYDRPE